MRLRFALGLLALTATAWAASSPTLAQSKLTVGYTSLSGVAPIFVAKEKDFFAKRGLEVDLQPLRGGNVLVPSLVANSIQVATLTAPTLVQAADGGIDLVGLTTLSVLSTGMTSSGVLARTGSNIKAPKDFNGKRLAVPTLGSISHVLFEKWLTLKGGDPKTIKWIEVAFTQMPDVIKTGNLDGLIIPDPLMTKIVKDGSGYVVSHFFGELPDNTSAMISASTRDWATKNPKEAAAYRDAIAEAVAYGNANRDETKQIIGKWLKLSPEIMQQTQLEKLVAELGADEMKWWVDTLNEQNLLRTKVDPAKLVFR
jgi:NitT/TauT family transport system substrate-binding protein